MRLFPPSQTGISKVSTGFGTDPDNRAIAKTTGFVSLLHIFMIPITVISETFQEKQREKCHPFKVKVFYNK